MEPSRLVVVSPVHNEGQFLERVARSLAAQSQPPAAWVVVDDGSDDSTPELLERLQAELPFLTAIRLPDSEDGGDRLVTAHAPRAFNAGLDLVALENFDYVAKIDGDI